jgi:DMSO reductase family type II enzyme molybdopterin subunit
MKIRTVRTEATSGNRVGDDARIESSPEAPPNPLELDGRFSRRDFIIAAGGTLATVALMPMLGCEGPPSEPAPAPSPTAAPTPTPTRPPDPMRVWEDAFRQKWTWDQTYSGTHNINCGWQVACDWKIYVKDGAVFREEQHARYPQTRAGVPDYNPRGCQKGCSYSSMMYNPARLTRPLKRVRPRGSKSWVPVSWDEALTDIADRMIDAITQHGPDTIVVDLGTNIIGQTAFASALMFGDAMDAVLLDMNTEIGDDQQGVVLTLGDVGGSRSPDDFFHSDLIFIWGGNPVVTQIPNFHFITEARYHGATVVAISPDLSPSATRADLWVPVSPGTDAALGLAMAKVMIDEGLCAIDVLREQTDLPNLVRLDNRKLLRESDLVRGGSDEQLYRWDTQRNQLEAIDTETLDLGKSVPALEGTFEIETLAGKVRVQPVFELLKAKLKDYTPEKAAKICGVSPDLIRKLARMIAGAKAASNVAVLGMGKYYHGDLMMRAQILAFVLAGHVGGKGKGYCSAGALLADGQSPVILEGSTLSKEVLWAFAKERGLQLAKGYLTGENARRNLQRAIADGWTKAKVFSNSTLFWDVHGGILDVSARPCDPTVKRDVREYVRESLDKGWQLVEPPVSKQPRVLFSFAGNALRRVRAGNRLREVLWPKLDLVVVLDVRMSSTAQYADYVLPVAGAYEKPNVIVMNSTTNVPFIHATAKAVENVGESKDEWEIACLIARKIQERARARGVAAFVGRRGHQRRLDGVYDVLTREGEFREKDAEKLSQVLVDSSSNLGDVKWSELKKDGIAPFSKLGKFWVTWGQASDIESGETIAPYTWHTEKKEPWPTLSGRIQFYIDHDWYLEMGEALPTHKDPPKAGGDYPLIMGGGHTRWSIHALWQSDPTLLRLQRGEPCMWISTEDAKERGIADGDRIEVFNDVGRFVTRAKVSPAAQPGQAIMYHAWEDYQFEGGSGHRNVMASPLKPLELAGGYPFLDPSMAILQPGMNDRDTRVEIRKV